MKSALDKMAVAAKTANAARGELLRPIPLDKVRFDPNQPRQDFHTIDGEVADDVMQGLQELADDIKQQGLIHPITVCEMPDGFYEVVVGERRTRANLLNGETEILAKIRNDLISGTARKLYQLAENIQRQDLNEHDQARFIHELVKSGEVQKQDLAKAFKKQPAWVTRYLSFADPILRVKWVDPGYVSKAWMLYALVQLPQHLQDEAMQMCKENNVELTSPQLKALEARARNEKRREAEVAAANASAAADANEHAKGDADHTGTDRDAAKSSAIAALLDESSAPINGKEDDDGYVPPADQLTALRDTPANLLDKTTAKQSQPSYQGDNPVSDFSGHSRVSTMNQMPAAATQTVAARISLQQLVTLQSKLRTEMFDLGAKTEKLPVDVRFDDALLRLILKELGVADATDLPQAVLPLKLIEVADRLTRAEHA
ncbi:ParB/RepB/Spo0J family partition protein [Chromobacterium piscinae]|uniref:ParB/RepB/Spo0J family partition protein n=1 Tax=Chromobacterium piscinae TaxID=686831 RepID=UPI001E6126E7|nr:ParB/RepB/Spo0J family partition protein [Chromobacterium piscinae]MCD5327937.1 ParB/RepB/Spo0J family partition protein [Chromobacterium piscinae]